jgi:hypothetical protein
LKESVQVRVLSFPGSSKGNQERRQNEKAKNAEDPDVVVSTGFHSLGMAVVAHAFGFVPYERIPILKWLVAAGGVGLFIYGLTWPH